MKEIKISETNAAKELYWKESVAEASPQDGEMKVVNIYADVQEQKIHGFGGAFTETAAHIYGGMSDGKKDEIMSAMYGKDGLCYNLGRVHMNSCDFSLGNYTYIDDGDASLESFSIAHDEKEILPLIHDAQKTAEDDIKFIMAPWSPPAFMKTNGDMNKGGKLKPEYADAWAKYFVKFIKAYAEKGVTFDFLNVQNEPAAVQKWDSCVYTAEEEAEFVRDHLYPALKEAGLADKVKIFVWDHNKELAYIRFRDSLNVSGASELIAGCSVHWYTGDHFDSLGLIRRKYPDKEIIFSEGCVELLRYADATATDQAERYAHDIIGNMNNGCSAFFDWNLVVDMQGGPNHVGNFCAAPIMCDPEADTYEKQLSYYYIGQFSRYVRRGAVHVASSRYTDGIDVCAFINPDGERVVVLLNKGDKDLPVLLREDGEGAEMTVAAHSIRTCRYYK